jgi:hypothetical protein
MRRLSFNAEPALWLGLAQAGIAIAVAFGMKLTVTQQGIILAGFAALVAVATRQSVTPAWPVANHAVPSPVLSADELRSMVALLAEPPVPPTLAVRPGVTRWEYAAADSSDVATPPLADLPVGPPRQSDS